MTTLAQIAGALEERGIAFAVIGAAAMALHGASRATEDFDLFAVDRRCLEPTTWRAIEASDSRIEIRKGDAEDPLAGVVRFESASERTVDLVVGRFAWQKDLLARAVVLPVGELALPVATREDLILLKLFAGGSQDAWDIEQLLAIGDRSSLLDAIDQSIANLPPESQDLWRRIRGS